MIPAMRTVIRRLALLVLAAGLMAGEPGTPFAAGDVLGRPGFSADNGLLAVGISPLGGRILRLDLAGRPLLWTDPKAVAEMRAPSGDGEDMWWFRGRGGAFLWPTPQAHWRRGDAPSQGWPPPPQLERGAMLGFPGPTGIDMHGPTERNPLWRSLGMQAMYRLVLPPGEARIRLHAAWANLAHHPQRAGQWLIATLPARSTGGPAEVVWPLRTARPSRFGERGYVQHHGDSDPEMWRPDAKVRLLRATCLGRPGKISSDSDGGWIAWRDPADGACLAIRFTPTRDEGRLPEGWSSVACNMMGDHAVEIEAMGPETDLDPGERLAATWELAACRTAGPIRAIAAGGIVSEPPTVADGRLRGSFGVFAAGRIAVRRAGAEVASVPCTPVEPAALDLALPAGTGPLELVVIAADGGASPLAALP